MIRKRIRSSIGLALSLGALACGDVPPEQRVEDLPDGPEAQEAYAPTDRAPAPTTVAKTEGTSGASDEATNDEQPSD